MSQHKTTRAALGLVILAAAVAHWPTAANVDDAAARQAISRLLHAEAAKQRELRDVDIDLELPAAMAPSTCSEPEAFLPHQGQRLRPGRVSIGLRCPGETARYIQIRLIMHGDYLELAHSLMPGDILSPDSIRRRRGDLGELPRDVLRLPRQAVGKLAVRRLDAGAVLRDNHLRSRPLVKRGQNVAVESRGRGFTVKRDGVAMENGGAGDRVRVRISPREILEAVVEENGRLVLQP